MRLILSVVYTSKSKCKSLSHVRLFVLLLLLLSLVSRVRLCSTP